MDCTTVKRYIKRHKFSRSINEELNFLIELDNWHGPLAVLIDYLVIAFAVGLYFISPYFYPFTVILIGARMGALSNLAHEAGHKRLVRNKTMNYVLGTFFTGYIILQEFHSYVDTHIRSHHNSFGHEDNDSDYSYHIQAGLYEPTHQKEFILKFILKPLLLLNLGGYVKHIFLSRGPKYEKYRAHFFIMYAYLGLICLTLWYFGWLTYLLIFWAVPYFTVFQLIGWFIDIAEHFPIMRGDEDLHMTRNRFSHPIEGIIFNIHNENYHLVHHLRPAIPFWNLSKAHKILMNDPTYKKINEGMGGIFVSSNAQKPIIRKIIGQEGEFANFFKLKT